MWQRLKSFACASVILLICSTVEVYCTPQYYSAGFQNLLSSPVEVEYRLYTTALFTLCIFKCVFLYFAGKCCWNLQKLCRKAKTFQNSLQLLSLRTW